MNPPRSLTVLNNRERRCGTCSACCTGAAVAALGKASGERCPHERGGSDKPGCAIYDSRPEECRTFRCLWLEGMGPDKHRPDRIGVFLGMREIETLPIASGVPGVIGQHLNGHRRAIVAVEVWKGAAETTARPVLEEIVRSAPLALVRFGQG